MRILRSGFAVAAVFVAACGPPDLSNRLSTDRAMDVVNDLVAFGDRSPGSNEDVAAYLRGKFLETGITGVEIQPFPIPQYVPRASEVTVLSPPEIAGPLGHLLNQFAGGGVIETSLVDVGNGRDVRPENAGKLVMIDALQTASTRVQYDSAVASNAAGIVFNSNVGGDYLRQRSIWRFERKGSLTGPIPAVSVTRGSAEAIRFVLGEGKEVRLRVQQSFEVKPAVGHTVVATIPGSKYPEKRIVINAHHDAWFSGAVDNAQAVAALLELAHAFQSAQPAYTIELIAFDCEEVGLFGSAAYLRALGAEKWRDIVAVISLEMLSPKNHDLAVLTIDPRMRDQPNAIWERVVKESGLTSLYPLVLSAADQMLAFNGEVPLDQKNFWEVGIPGFYVVTTYEPFHSERDTPEEIDTLRFGKILSALTRSVQLMQEHPPERVGLRPTSWLDVSSLGFEAPQAGKPLTGILEVTRHDGTKVPDAELIVTLYNAEGDPQFVYDEAAIEKLGDGTFRFTFKLPVSGATTYTINASATGYLLSGRTWFRVQVP